MIVKGIVSAIYPDEKKIAVILPEYDNMTTQPLSIYGNPNMGDYEVNDFVLVAVFNEDFNDAIILSETSSSGGASGSGTDLPLSVVNGMLCITYKQ